MKKAVFLFILLLIGSIASLSVLGREGEYVAEKTIWKINRDFEGMAKDPKTTPDAAFDRIIHRYRKFIQKFPNSRLTSSADISAGSVYMFKKDYSKAREELEKVIKKYPDNPKVVVKSMEIILRSYGKEEDGEGVLKTYDRILKDYPATSLGLKIPLLISQFYKNRNNLGKSEEALVNGIQHFEQLGKKYSDTVIEHHILESMSTCYLGLKKWKEAVNTLGALLIKFSDARYLTPEKGYGLTRSINTISIYQLKDTQLPIKIYRKFIVAHPEHPFNKTLEEIIQKLNLLKEEKKDILL